MSFEINEAQAARQAGFREFVRTEIAPHANRWDREERIPSEVLARIGQMGYLGALIPTDYGGSGMDMITFGLLNEEVGRGCSSVRSLLTVHGMVQFAILRWGNEAQKKHWLPRLATGEVIGAFGLTEPNVGSDARSVETSATVAGGFVHLATETRCGHTFGQIADVYLIFAQQEGRICTFLVERDRPGFSATPLSGVLGTRASMLANLRLDSCEIPKENRVGGVGFGLSAVGSAALDIGRYSVACGCVGVAQACLDASIAVRFQPETVRLTAERPSADPKDDYGNGCQCQCRARAVLPRRVPQGSRRFPNGGRDAHRQVLRVEGRRAGRQRCGADSRGQRLQCRLPRATLLPRCEDFRKSSKAVRRSWKSPSPRKPARLWSCFMSAGSSWDRSGCEFVRERRRAGREVSGLGSRQHALGRCAAGGSAGRVAAGSPFDPPDPRRARHLALDRQP